jgi:hypothetical protein
MKGREKRFATDIDKKGLDISAKKSRLNRRKYRLEREKEDDTGRRPQVIAPRSSDCLRVRMSDPLGYRRSHPCGRLDHPSRSAGLWEIAVGAVLGRATFPRWDRNAVAECGGSSVGGHWSETDGVQCQQRPDHSTEPATSLA